MEGYATPTPIDRRGNVLPLTAPAYPAIQTNSAGIPTSSLVTLDNRATFIQITTQSNPVVGKWFGSGVANPSVTAANFDFSIPGNWTNYQVIPVSTIGVANAGSIVGGYGAQNGLYTNLALIGIGNQATSIMVTQYV